MKAELAETELLCQRGGQGIGASCFRQVGMKGRVEDGVLRNVRQSLPADVYDAERIGLWIGASGMVRCRADRTESSIRAVWVNSLPPCTKR